MNRQNLKIVFLGTPEFAVKPLETLVKAGYEIIGVITSPDKPVGRKMVLTPPPVKVLAEKRQLPVYQPKDKTELVETMKKIQPDLAVVAAFGMIFTKEILEIPKFGFLNIHASLLPRWRGASPIQSAILAGDEETGVTIMLLNEKMDEGPILAQRELEFSIFNPPAGRAGFQFSKLQEELSKLGAQLLTKTIPKWIAGEIKPQTQDDSKATYCKKITKDDGSVDLNAESPETIERKIRAFTPWPGAYIFTGGKRLIITQAEIIHPHTKNFGVGASGSLKIKRVKPEGKNEMNFADYLRGNPDKNLEKYL